MHVSVYSAKSNLSDFLDKVLAGNEVVITRDGEPVAKLVPVSPPTSPDRARAIRHVRALSRRLNIVSRVPLRRLVEEGWD